MYKSVILIFIFAFIVAGCDSTGMAPPPEGQDPPPAGENEVQRDVAGAYSTTTFIVYPEEMQDTLNVGEGGGFIHMTLYEDSTVQGRMYVPEEYLGEGEPDREGDVDMYFGGAYHTRGDTVFFDHASDTFIRDTEWLWSENTLRVLEWEGTVILTKEDE